MTGLNRWQLALVHIVSASMPSVTPLLFQSRLKWYFYKSFQSQTLFRLKNDPQTSWPERFFSASRFVSSFLHYSVFFSSVQQIKLLSASGCTKIVYRIVCGIIATISEPVCSKCNDTSCLPGLLLGWRHSFRSHYRNDYSVKWLILVKLECGPMPNVNIGGALCSTPQSLANAHY